MSQTLGKSTFASKKLGHRSDTEPGHTRDKHFPSFLLPPTHYLVLPWSCLLTLRSFQLLLGPGFPKSELPKVNDLWGMHDFDYAARNFLNDTAYAWIRYGTGGEYTYRNNMEIFPRVGFKPRVLTGPSNMNMSMQ